MLLSDNSIDALAAATRPGFVVQDSQARAGAREAVTAAAKELDLDPVKMTGKLPRFAAGEDVLHAAVRVLQLDKVEKALAAAHARAEASQTHAAEVAALRDRRAELVRIELVRRQDALKAGKVPPPMPAKVRDELAELNAELYPVETLDVRQLISYEPDRGVIEDALPPRGLVSIVFYGELVAERLRGLTENEQYSAPAARTASRAAAEVRSLGHSNRLLKQPELDATIRRVRSAIELADLHLRHQKQALSIEQLESASSSTGPSSIEQLDTARAG
jgi:hypothetical protein